MPTSIDMASNALILIGDEPISSFDDPGAGAKAAANLYPETYGAVLSSHPWTFALKEQKLNLLSQTPDPLTNFQFAFQLPTDFIRLWAIFPFSNYTIVGSILYANTNELLARYCFRVDETALPPHMTKAIEYKLASEFAMLVTESQTKAEFYEKKFNLQVAQARTIDSQQKPQVPIIDSPFVDVRLGGFSSSGL